MSVTGYAFIDENDQVLPRNIGGLVKPQGLIARMTSIDGLTTGNTNLYTVPSGKVAIVISAILRLTTAVGLSGLMRAGIGINSEADDIFTSAVLMGFDSTSNFYQFLTGGVKAIATSESVIKLGIDTAFVGTGALLTAYLYGIIDS